MMKKLFIALVALVGAATANAQEFYGVGNRIGVGVGVGTEGIGVDAAVSLTKYVSVRAGVNFIPDFDITADADIEGLDQTVNYQVNNQNYTTTVGELYRDKFGKTMSDEIEAKLSLKRTTIDVKVDVYPFPGVSSFFLCGGFSFGGKQVIKATGHSDAMADVAGLKTSDPAAYNAIMNSVGVDIDESMVKFDDNGDISATAEVKGFRPYLGLGFGRLIPKNRLGFRFELGAQFQGRPKILDADGKDIVNDYGLSESDKNDITKVLDYMKVYPVLKLSIRGRIL